MNHFSRIISKLEGHYGAAAGHLSEPLHLIIWDHAGYLVEDDRRRAVFEELRNKVGFSPAQILAAPIEQLTAIMKSGGIHPELRARRLKEIAHIVLNDFGGDLNQVLKLSLAKAIKELKKFPSIADPGAEKVLLFSKTYPVLALESNGLRVLLRLGFGDEQKNYSASYRSTRQALADQVGTDCGFLIKAHQLLRRHGKELCRTNHPACPECPLKNSCRYANERKTM